MSLKEVEKYLGKPMTTVPIDEFTYANLYGYEQELGVTETRSLDFLNLITFGLGNYIVTPMDRYSGTRHLVAITFIVAEGYNREKDRVAKISTDLVGEP
jgi:hypothetical protein